MRFRWWLLVLAFVSPCLAEEAAVIEEPPIDESDRNYWAYQPVIRPAVPEVLGDEWSRNPIDRFVLAKLHEKELTPATQADRFTLLRRVKFDLTGLPPTLDEIQEAQRANSHQDWYEPLITQLLESPAYGVRWAQHWLDLVRFAETDGFEHDKVRPEAWRYRDWVIEALNKDLPYDEFVRLQIAGDEIDPDSKFAVLATGFLLAGPDMPDINLQQERRHNFLNGMTANVGEVLMGLRFGCSECHHHRTDPISQQDFYRLRAFFDTIDLFKDHPVQLASDKTIKARVVTNAGSYPDSHLWVRGDFRRQGAKLSPRFPRVLRDGESSFDGQNRRTALAEWLTSEDHPLTARVMVNRVWQHHFGVGLIPTPSDFGWLGEPCSHPELLDWLAEEFMAHDWSLKYLHRLIVTSSTYQLVSHNTDAAATEHWANLIEKDPSNRLLGRSSRRRLEGEAIRDAILAVSGKLNEQAGGPGVRPPLPPAVASTLLKNQWPVTEEESQHTRRSIYLFARRNLRLPLLEVFDKPDSNLSCPRRAQTTISPQALHLLNSDFVREQAEHFATRIQVAESPGERIQLCYQLAFGRAPSESELASAREFAKTDSEEAWADFCHALLNLNEFVYVD